MASPLDPWALVYMLASALASSFLSSYLTYLYTDKLWRRRRHLEDLKENCLKNVLNAVERFERFFVLDEGRIVNWVVNENFRPPSTEWCEVFSFGFEDPPTTRYLLLLHDLGNHFPDLVSALKEFEERVKRLCPEYAGKLYEVTRLALERAREMLRAKAGKAPQALAAMLAESVIMIVSGYGESYWPNNRDELKRRGLLELAYRLAEELEEESPVREYVRLRGEALALVQQVKAEVLKALHAQRLPGKCGLH